MKDEKLDYFKKLVIEHLESLEADKKELKKSLLEAESIAKGGKGLPVGTVRDWKGRKYVKVAPGKWKPKYDSHSRGAKLSIAALKRKADECKSSEELLQLVLENRERFSDEMGRPLPFVKELSDYISAKNDELENGKKPAKEEPKLDVNKDGLKLHFESNNKDEELKELNKIAEKAGLSVVQDFNGRTQITNKKGDGVTVLKGDTVRLENGDFIVEKPYGGTVNVSKQLGGKSEEEEPKKTVAEMKAKDDEKIQVNETPEDRAQVTKTQAFNKEIETLTNSSYKADSVEDAIKALEKHKEFVHSIIPQNETLHEKATREGREEAIQSIIDKLKQGIKDIIAMFVKAPEKKVQEQEEKELEEKYGAEPETTIKDIRDKYEASKSVTGNKKTVTLPDGTKIKCHYKIVEAEAPTASHDERTFAPSKGFPTTKDGKSVNDRDYQNDADAQESVRKIASNFNSLALESPPIVTKDGIVISGNNRTMSSKLAARQGTDKAYLQDLREMADEYGIEPEDLNGFENPRLILETDNEHEGDYTTEEFAQFNRDTKKTMSNVEKAVKLTKTLNEQKISSIASELSNYDTMSDMYNDPKGSQAFVSKLIEAGIIGDNEKAQYCKSDGTLNDTGKDFVETVLVGSVLNENNIRKLDGAGGKRIRQKLVRAILPLIENKGNGKEYSFNAELNTAVDIAVTVAKDHDTFKTVDDYLAQGSLFGDEKPDVVTGRLAKIIHDEGEKAFAKRMKDLGAGLQESASGVCDIFLGGVESKQSLMERFLDIKKSIADILTNLVRKERTTRELVASVLNKIS